MGKEKSEGKAEFFGKSKIEKFDELDIRILRSIASNSRIPIIKLAEKLKTSERTIAFRIKQLEKKKIIQGYRALFDLNLLGFEYYKVDLVLIDISRLKELISYAYSHPNFVYIDETIGESDFEFDLEVESKKKFLEIINDLRTKFPEIREWSYFTLRNYRKLLYFPEK